MAAKKSTTKKTGTKKKNSQKNNKGQSRDGLFELAGLIYIAVSVLLAICFFITAKTGIVGSFIKNLFYGIFGIPAVFIPFFLAGGGIYVMIRRDYDRLYTKLTLMFLMLFDLSILWQVCTYTDGGIGIAEAFELGSAGSGGGVLGALVANLLSKYTGAVIGIIIAVTLLLVISMFLFKISFFGMAKGFFSRAKKEAAEIKGEESYEMGRRARSRVDDSIRHIDEGLHRVKNRNIDIDIDDMNGGKNSKKKKKRGMDRTEGIDIPLDMPSGKNADDTEISTGRAVDPYDFPDDIFAGYEDTDTDDEMILPPGEDDMEVPTAKKKPERLSAAAEAKLAGELNEAARAVEIPYKYPPATLLSVSKGKKGGDTPGELRQTAAKLVETLKSFGVDVTLLDVSRGPAVTRYELQPNVGVKVSKITGLSNDIALSLAATAVRIEAPIPGKAAIGIEVPNKTVSDVALRDILESDDFKSANSKLSVALGMDISGKPVVADIAKMPHVLIAGTTGSGKSVCINSIITSILYKSNPNEVKLVLIDPKVVELGVYNGIPHLLIPVVTEPKKAAGALNWAVSEMVNRYNLFAQSGTRDLKGYNEYLVSEGLMPLPQIVIVIDELADLMMVAPKEIEDSICRLAQMARAAGMHLIIATQRPDANVVTGLIKANIPSRIAFAVQSGINSRIILDAQGAEKLLGKGDMLFLPMGKSKPTRVQGAFVSDKEVESVIDFIKDTSGAPTYDEDIEEKINSGDAPTDSGLEDGDDLLPQAIEIAISMGNISTSMVQRRLGVGYARAGRIIDQMEQRGIISGPDGAKPRKVLVSSDFLDN